MCNYILQDKIESTEKSVSELRDKIEGKSAIITDTDLNILSAATRDIEIDIGWLRATKKASIENTYKDNIDFYDNKINSECARINRKCKIVNYLLNIAIDDKRESLLQYLKYNKPYEKFE